MPAIRRTETAQNKKEPDILSQVNRTCPPGQIDTIPSGDSVMDVPKINSVKYKQDLVIL